jgi:pimeloyl-ACP methyl ester carboxylesterase
MAVDKTYEQLRRSYTARAAFKGSGLRVFADLDAAIEARRSAGQLSAQAARCIVERGVRDVVANEALAKSGDEDVGFDGAKAKSGDGERGLERDNALPGLSWSSDPALTLPSPTRLTEEQLAVILPNIAAKTLLVLAEPETPYLQRATMDARIALLGDIEVIRMAGTHHLHLEDPAPVAAAINRFLETA